jgi:hypothetical protein
MAKKVVKKISNERHWGITVLSVLSYIGAVITVLLGLTMLFGSSTFSSLIGKAFPQLAAYADVGTIRSPWNNFHRNGCSGLFYCKGIVEWSKLGENCSYNIICSNYLGCIMAF